MGLPLNAGRRKQWRLFGFVLSGIQVLTLLPTATTPDASP